MIPDGNSAMQGLFVPVWQGDMLVGCYNMFSHSTASGGEGGRQGWRPGDVST